jgi:hypothetical protein
MNGEHADTAFSLWVEAAGLIDAVAENRDLREGLEHAIRSIPDCEQNAANGDGAQTTLVVVAEDAIYTVHRDPSSNTVETTRLRLDRASHMTVAREWRTHQQPYREQVSTWTFEFDGATRLTLTTRRAANESDPPLEQVARAIAARFDWSMS